MVNTSSTKGNESKPLPNPVSYKLCNVHKDKVLLGQAFRGNGKVFAVNTVKFIHELKKRKTKIEDAVKFQQHSTTRQEMQWTPISPQAFSVPTSIGVHQD